MKTQISLIKLLVIPILVWPFTVQGVQEYGTYQDAKIQKFIAQASDSPRNPTEISHSKPLIEYIPPPSDKPEPVSRVVAGGTREAKINQSVRLTLIAPMHIAQTIQSQPTLYWYLSKDIDLPAVFTLTEYDGIMPLIEKKLPTPLRSGFHPIAIADYGVELEIGKAYEWSISLLKDTEQQRPSSRDIIEKAFIKRVQNRIEGTDDMARLGSIARASAYAEQSLWYDSFESLMEIASTGAGANNQAALNARSNLLAQVGLSNF